MTGRRQFLIHGAAASTLLVPGVVHAGSKRPHLEVEVHDNHPLKMTLRDYIPAPVKRVADTIGALETWADWVPLFTKSDVSNRKGSTMDLAGRLDLPWPVADRHFVAAVTKRGTAMTLGYVPDSGNMKDFFITVKVLPWTDRGAMVESTIEADFGIRLTKGFIEWLTRRKAPQMFDALEARTAG